MPWKILCLKCVRWTGWLLVPIVLLFLVSGYAITGQYGLAALADERTALALHRLLHVPLLALVLLHVLPASYLALVRWGWLHASSDSR